MTNPSAKHLAAPAARSAFLYLIHHGLRIDLAKAMFAGSVIVRATPRARAQHPEHTRAILSSGRCRES